MKNINTYTSDQDDNKMVVISMPIKDAQALYGFIVDVTENKKIPAKRSRGHKVVTFLADEMCVW